jgi:hypothetical protein
MEWRDIPGYEGIYRISDEGVVERLKHVGQWRPLKPGSNKQGRLQVTLCSDGVMRRFQVHKLVLEAFVGPCPDGLEACHGDGDHRNCSLGNLRWDTRESNRADAIRHGTHVCGEKSGLSRLTEDQVRAIRASSESQRDLAVQFGVSQPNIHAIITRRTWKHI